MSRDANAGVDAIDLESAAHNNKGIGPCCGWSSALTREYNRVKRLPLR
jgi:hypothetical protein